MGIRELDREGVRRLKPGDVSRSLGQADVYHILRELFRERFVGPLMALLDCGAEIGDRKSAADELNLLAHEVPEGVMNVLARDLVIRLREGNPISNPTAVLDLSDGHDRMGHRIAESINSTHRSRVVKKRGGLRKKDRVLVVCFCVPEWLVLDQALVEAIPSGLGIWVEPKHAAVIDASKGSRWKRSIVSLLDRSVMENK